jgi:hypothetical protein
MNSLYAINFFHSNPPDRNSGATVPSLDLLSAKTLLQPGIGMFPRRVISIRYECDIVAVHDHLSLLRFLEAGDDGHGLLPAFLPVRFMRKNAHAQAGRLLRVLQLRNSRLSTHPARRRGPCVAESGKPPQMQRPRCGSLRCRFAAPGVSLVRVSLRLSKTRLIRRQRR